MNYNQILKEILIPNKKGINHKLLNRILYNQNKYCNIFNYLLHKVYKDSVSIEETLKRMQLNIDIKPLCPICHKPVNFIGKKSKMFSKYCSTSCRAKDPKNYEKWVNGQKKFNMDNYGVKYNFQRNDIKNKRKETLIEHYGTTKLYSIPSIKEKIDKSIKDKKEEIRNNHNKVLKEKYNVNSFGQLLTLPEIQEKINNTKKKNGTYKKSNTEDQSYELLKEKFEDVKRQYRSDLYPFNCDFYIPSLDIYIECNYSQFHCSHPFNDKDDNDLKILEELKEKANNSIRKQEGKKSQYDNMIYTWTDLDVRKRNIAKQNNLNYLEFWDIKELKKWINEL